MEHNEPTHFRIRDKHQYNGIVASLERFYTIKTTPKGVWVRSEYMPSWVEFKEARKRKYLKFILNGAGKRYCYPTIEEAVESFRIRKIRQQGILELQLEQINCCVENIDKLKGVGVESFIGRDEGVLLGETPSHYRFCFDY